MFESNCYTECVLMLDRVNAFEKDEKFAFIKVSMSGGEDFLVLKYPTFNDRDADYNRLYEALKRRVN